MIMFKITKGALMGLDWTFRQCREAVNSFSEAYREVQQERIQAEQQQANMGEAHIASDGPS